MSTQPTPTSWQTAPPAGNPPAQANRHPMAGHVKAIAIIDFVNAGLTFLAALAIIFAFGVGAAAVDSSEQYGAPGWVADMLGAMAFVLGAISVAFAVVYLMAGIKLIGFKRSGKALGITAAVFQILFGLLTVMGGIGIIWLGAGIYSIVILAREDTSQLLVN